MVMVSRPAGGICLNASIREYLLDYDGNPKRFATVDAAKRFLRDMGFSDDDMVGLEFEQE
jgi:hypothetical protein